MVRETEADAEYCPPKALDNEDGCYYALRIATDGDIRWLSKECCTAVRTLPDGCYLLAFPGKAYPLDFFTTICDKKVETEPFSGADAHLRVGYGQATVFGLGR
ncbi:hypothetical protein YC2023_006761 [Brassica napus]